MSDATKTQPCEKCRTEWSPDHLPCPVCSEIFVTGTILFDGVPYRGRRNGDWERLFSNGVPFGGEWRPVTEEHTLAKLRQKAPVPAIPAPSPAGDARERRVKVLGIEYVSDAGDTSWYRDECLFEVIGTESAAHDHALDEIWKARQELTLLRAQGSAAPKEPPPLPPGWGTQRETSRYYAGNALPDAWVAELCDEEGEPMGTDCGVTVTLDDEDRMVVWLGGEIFEADIPHALVDHLRWLKAASAPQEGGGR